jgi:hypothetical protein
MVWLTKLLEIIKSPYTWYKEEKAFKKRLKKMKEQDPFIYK